MITMRRMHHVRTTRNIKGFRSGRHATGVVPAHLDGARIQHEKERLFRREFRRVWLAQQWDCHALTVR